ncbi:orotidine-5'-phosphate decarboxylase [Salibacter sp.]|uniref:orotidine-5'-phosphate decarboxylase n=1 Tax=Salibacter sp. TaxID=2010995 RepID=UPI00286FBB52|nr:orotidine-5'-phosphate decarboxylase [Salibacter sp.]MDR9397953.1 orotidine-5'-phosphate decarboxylase [Salibacter sp.]MDR9486481.1 orotidine-5'-phosphate decarboxylase [Salibacter sp.]
MNRSELVDQIKSKRSFLCVGLDTDLEKIPKHLLEFDDPIFEFNKRVIDATKNYAVAYKPNIAFYESLGSRGWESLRKTLDHIPGNIFTIADAKRGDIGNTSAMYAKTFFDHYNFDSITIAPYMGHDSVEPFKKDGKWTIVLALTSNPGANDFQLLKTESGKRVFEEVIEKNRQWSDPDQLMFVVGATRGELIGEVRKAAPDNFFLVPGVGKQGGSLENVAKFGMIDDCGLLVNSSRGIIYASNGRNFADKAAEKASAIQSEMSILLERFNVC